MDVVFNDFSIDGQFTDIEAFIDSIYIDTLPSIEYIANSDGFLLMKSKAIFEKNICEDVNFGVFLSVHSFSYPELLKFKSALVQLVNEPFWEENVCTDKDGLYHCNPIGDFYGAEANCFSESFERNCPLLSLRHNNFSETAIAIEKNAIQFSIANFFNYESLCEYLFSQRSIGFSDYLLRKKHPIEVQFLSNNKNEYYADACFNGGEIEISDIKGISETFERHIRCLHDGTQSPLTKSITHRGITYFEFRDKLKDNREFRIFYYRTGNKLIYLNSHLKKTQRTPNEVKNYTVDLIKQYKLC